MKAEIRKRIKQFFLSFQDLNNTKTGWDESVVRRIARSSLVLLFAALIVAILFQEVFTAISDRLEHCRNYSVGLINGYPGVCKRKAGEIELYLFFFHFFNKDFPESFY